jgi:hypothetical protein
MLSQREGALGGSALEFFGCSPRYGAAWGEALLGCGRSGAWEWLSQRLEAERRQHWLEPWGDAAWSRGKVDGERDTEEKKGNSPRRWDLAANKGGGQWARGGGASRGWQDRAVDGRDRHDGVVGVLARHAMELLPGGGGPRAGLEWWPSTVALGRAHSTVEISFPIFSR